ELAVPALTNCLLRTERDLRAAAIGALCEFGTNAHIAVPALVEASRDADYRVQSLARLALRKIAPEIYEELEASGWNGMVGGRNDGMMERWNNGIMGPGQRINPPGLNEFMSSFHIPVLGLPG